MLPAATPRVSRYGSPAIEDGAGGGAESFSTSASAFEHTNEQHEY